MPDLHIKHQAISFSWHVSYNSTFPVTPPVWTCIGYGCAFGSPIYCYCITRFKSYRALSCEHAPSSPLSQQPLKVQQTLVGSPAVSSVYLQTEECIFAVVQTLNNPTAQLLYCEANHPLFLLQRMLPYWCTMRITGRRSRGH